MEQNFRVHIVNEYWMDRLNFYFAERRGGKVYFYNLEDGRWNTVEHEIGSTGKPTFSMSGMMAQEFMKAMADELSKHGVRTDNDAKVQGTLEATRGHLEDLRHLLKLPKEKT